MTQWPLPDLRANIGDQLTCVFLDHRLMRWGEVFALFVPVGTPIQRGWLEPAFLDRLDLQILVNAFALRALRRLT